MDFLPLMIDYTTYNRKVILSLWIFIIIKVEYFSLYLLVKLYRRFIKSGSALATYSMLLKLYLDSSDNIKFSLRKPTFKHKQENHSDDFEGKLE